MKRERLIKPAHLLWSLIGAVSNQTAHQIADVYRQFLHDSPQSVGWSSWYEQIQKPEFPIYVHQALLKVMEDLYISHFEHLPEVFSRFEDVLIQDGTSFSVNAYLSRIYPGRFNHYSPAAVELHMVYSLKRQQYVRAELAPDRQSEQDFMPDPASEEVKNRLYIFDRGYVHRKKLQDIADAEGYFLVRSKKNLNPLVIRSFLPGVWNVAGKKLKEIVQQAGKDYDLEVEFELDRKPCRMRQLCLWNPVKREHTLFLTNLTLKQATARQIGVLYRLRWQIEISFKELKSFSGLKRYMTCQVAMVTALIWVSLLTMQLRRYLLLAAESLAEGKRLSRLKAASSSGIFMPDLIGSALQEFRNLEQVLEKILRYLVLAMEFSRPPYRSTFEICQTEFERKEQVQWTSRLAA